MFDCKGCLSLGGAGQAISSSANGEFSTSSKRRGSLQVKQLGCWESKRGKVICQVEGKVQAVLREVLLSKASEDARAEGCAESFFSHWFNLPSTRTKYETLNSRHAGECIVQHDLTICVWDK